MRKPTETELKGMTDVELDKHLSDLQCEYLGALHDYRTKVEERRALLAQVRAERITQEALVETSTTWRNRVAFTLGLIFLSRNEMAIQREIDHLEKAHNDYVGEIQFEQERAKRQFGARLTKRAGKTHHAIFA